MSGPYDGDLRLEVAMLKAELSRLREMVKMRWQDSTPRLLLSKPLLVVPAILNGQLNAQSFANASFMRVDSPTTPTPLHPNDNFTVYDWMMNTGDSIANGSKIWVCEWRSYWWVVVPYCSITNTNPPSPPTQGFYEPVYPINMLHRKQSQQINIANIALGSSTGTMTGEGAGIP